MQAYRISRNRHLVHAGFLRQSSVACYTNHVAVHTVIDRKGEPFRQGTMMSIDSG